MNIKLYGIKKTQLIKKQNTYTCVSKWYYVIMLESKTARLDLYMIQILVLVCFFIFVSLFFF